MQVKGEGKIIAWRHEGVGPGSRTSESVSQRLGGQGGGVGKGDLGRSQGKADGPSANEETKERIGQSLWHQRKEVKRLRSSSGLASN